MNHKTSTFAMFAVALFGAATIASSAEVPAHLALGRQLVAQIQTAQAEGTLVDANNVEFNRYGGSWGSSYIQFADPINQVPPGNYSQCGSFVTLLLKAAYDWNWNEYVFWDPIQQEWNDTISPSSYRYEALIKQNVGFDQELTRLDQVLPGDVITMVYVNDDSGHTGLVNEIFLNSGRPYPEGYPNSDPALYGTTFYELEILDCSSSDHTNDTRQFDFNGQQIDTDGVGIGRMGILANANLEVVGYTWSLPSSNYDTKPNSWLSGLHSRLKLQTVRAVTFGRLDLDSPVDPADPVDPVDTTDSVDPVDPAPAGLTHEVEAPAPIGPSHLSLGMQLVAQMVAQQTDGFFNDVDGVSLNRYGGSWGSNTDPVYIQWANAGTELPAASYSQCSSFVTLLLKAAYNWNWKDYSFHDPILDEVVSKSSPHSYRYVALIKQLVGFSQQILRLDQAAPGDVLAVHELGTTSGHTALFIGVDWASAKVYPGNLAASDPALAGTTYYEVQVLDVNKSAHSFDTRRLFNNGIEEETGGAGIGVMGILVDANFEIVAHTWSIPTSDYVTHTDSWLDSLHGRLKLQNEREMVIGRIPAMP